MTPTPDLDQFLPSDAELAERRATFVAQLRGGSAPARSRIGTRRTIALSLGIVVLAGGGVAGAAALLRGEDVAVSAGIGCYERASLDADVAVVGPTPDPIGACQARWRNGAIDGTPHAAVPALVACTAKGEPVRVFPGNASTCSGMDLEPLPGSYADAAATGRAVIEAVGSLGEGRCLTATRVRAEARAALDARGLTRIPVVDGDLGGDCAHVFVDGLTVKIETHNGG